MSCGDEHLGPWTDTASKAGDTLKELGQFDSEKSSMVDDLQELKKKLDSAKEELLKERGQNGALIEEIQALEKTLDDNRGTSHDADECVKCQCGQEGTEVLGLRMEHKEEYQENCQQEREECEANKQELTEKPRLYLRCERNDQGLLSDLKEDLKGMSTPQTKILPTTGPTVQKKEHSPPSLLIYS
ncbi:hypothetical protein GDO86_001355 [Hymenochirus boettgeri]|uniref:Uncharacterized protein n=1 Tax=Hymenochirus boettgeri TaxID=247094 RepID=A0A8T2KL46_9PIPI|nr:hypothetical protein GDO86_001355 [Hymenochirus boettgeri]